MIEISMHEVFFYIYLNGGNIVKVINIVNYTINIYGRNS